MNYEIFNSSDKLQDHVFETYMNLRNGIVFFSCLLPIILIGYGYFFQNIEMQGSLSAYFHACPEDFSIPTNLQNCFDQNPTDPKLKEIVDAYAYAYFHIKPGGQFLRTIFVSFLIGIGICLYLFKGFSNRENIALNFAGLFAFLVAIFPMDWSPIYQAQTYGPFSLHGIFAVLLVLCIAYVCIWRPSKTLHYLKDDSLRKKFRIEYNILGGLMIALPIGIFLYLSLIGKSEKLILWLEVAVLIIFARFWWLKGKEIMIINSDKSDYLSRYKI